MVGLGTIALFLLMLSLLTAGSVLILCKRRTYLIAIAVRLLKGHRNSNLALTCAACVSTIVVTGSFIAGDSLRESITNAVYDNLSEVDEVITSDRLFNASVATRLAENETLNELIDHVSSGIQIRGIVENPTTGARTNNANIIGFDESFFELGELISTDSVELIGLTAENEIYINKNLADEIGTKIGDRINLSTLDLDQVFGAVFLGDQKNTNLKVQLEIKDIVKPEGLGRFQLNSNRKAPQNVYVPLSTLQKVLGVQDQLNIILISNTGDVKEGAELCNRASSLIRNALNDLLTYEDSGLKISQSYERGYVKVEARDVFFSFDYYEILSKATPLIDSGASSPILTYFWNTLSHEDRFVPYSTVTAFDFDLDLKFGSFTLHDTSQTIEGELGENEIILNNWTAESLQADVGDMVLMNYSVLDEFYNVKYLKRNFTVKYIVTMDGKANDSLLMPSFPGIEGKSSAFDWDPPFPINLNKITEDDEKYWEDFQGTPKAFVALGTGIDLWGTGIGNITQIRLIPSEASNISALMEQVKSVLNVNNGMNEAFLILKAIKSDALNSVEGIQLFTEMFLAFSASCIIASAVLIVLLVTLRIEYRTNEIGILRALGIKKGTITHIYLVESTLLSIVGGFLGVVFGLIFGYFLITGMNTFWSPIVEGSSVEFFYSLDSLVIGFCAGIIIVIITVLTALRYEIKRTVVRTLKHLPHIKERRMGIHTPLIFLMVGAAITTSVFISGSEIDSEVDLLSISLGPILLIFSIRGLIQIKTGKRIDIIIGLFIVIFALFFAFHFVDRFPVYELFFLSGFMFLVGFLLIFNYTIMRIEGFSISGHEKISQGYEKGGHKSWLLHFSVRNAVRRPRRTLFTTILFSLTLFVLVSLTINLQGAINDVDEAVKVGGGGYHIIGESTNPIFANLADEASRTESNIHSQTFDELYIEQFKTKGDVGGTCSNLNREANPRLIGANESFLHHNGFEFVSHAELVNNEQNPWLLLEDISDGDYIPVIGDYNTIIWILGLNLDSTISILDESGTVMNLKIVGILTNSIFQGSLILWDENFDVLFPTNDGYNLFLFKSQASNLEPQMIALESALAGYGFDAYTVESVVVENLLIENTYISIFQVILVFGLIIGTLGFGIVVSRNTFERRRELGILRSLGFSRKTILKALMIENSLILISGIIIGTISGLLASSVYLVEIKTSIASLPWLEIVGILLLSYVVAILSAILPINKASRMSVSESLRASE